MKKILILLSFFAIVLVQVQAQRYLPGQRGIQLSGGFADGFSLKNKDGAAYYGNISMSTYNKKGNRWIFGGEYLQKQYEYKDNFVPVSQITAEGGYYVKFLSDPSKTVFFSLGGSALAGYETLNWGKSRLTDGASLQSEDGFIYGGAISFEIETFILDRLVFLVNMRERAMFGSEINTFHFQLGCGIKIIIN